jgi:hypothetical protein
MLATRQLRSLAPVLGSPWNTNGAARSSETDSQVVARPAVELHPLAVLREQGRACAEDRLRQCASKLRQLAHHLIEHHYIDRVDFETLMTE